MKAATICSFLAVFILASCKSMDSEPSMQGGFDVGYSSAVEIKGAFPDELRVSLKDLKDTRCPIDVICIQPGWVELTFWVQNQTDSTIVEAVFHENRTKDKPAIFQLGAGSYSLRVFKVSPYPLEGKKIDKKNYYVNLDIAAL